MTPARATDATGASAAEATVYFDHPASSWPKPPVVVEAIHRALVDLGGNPGRGAYRLAIESARAIHDARAQCAALLGVTDARNLMFVPGSTYGSNIMLKGVLRSGDRVLVSEVEHNAVVRPLAALTRDGITVETIPVDGQGRVDPAQVEKMLRATPARAVVCQHVSNVTGAIHPIVEIAAVAQAAGAVLLVDGAQGAGHLDVDLRTLGADAYTISGHKGMLGPQGVGLLYLDPDMDVEPLFEGGTGSHSESERMPLERPERFEPGTPNTPGIVGLGAAAAFLAAHGGAQREQDFRFTTMLHEAVISMGGYRVLGPGPGEPRAPLLSIVPERMAPAELAMRLDRDYGIACRAGLHCSPRAHDSAGSSKTGACRFGPGYGTTEHDVEMLISALREFA